MHPEKRADASITGQSIATLFEQQARQRWSDLAILGLDHSLTYGQLSELSNQWARFLRRTGAKPGDRIAVSVARSTNAVVALLGVMKAGCAYVAVDVSWPEARRATILNDVDARVIITDSVTRGITSTCAIVSSGEAASSVQSESTTALEPPPQANGCCILYTSGVSGTPKGVLVPHRALLSHFSWMQSEYPLYETDVALVHRSYGVMAACWDYFGPLLAGAKLVIVPQGVVSDVALILRTAVAHRITHVSGSPSFWQGILDQPAERLRQWRTLRLGVSSGEQMSPELVFAWRKRFPEACLLNIYGCTESVRPIAYDTSHLKADAVMVPIGKAVADASVCILDEAGNEAGGDVGEICVGGPCLTDGYLNDPMMTAERFFDLPSSTNSIRRMYRTGDFGRVNEDGFIELIGRKDHQVKVRGFRVNLNEIEVALKRNEWVRDAVVVLDRDSPNTQHLIAYVVQSADRRSSDELRATLSAMLPEYMVPAFFVSLDAIPLTTSGKRDRALLAALPRPARYRANVGSVDSIEGRLIEIWADVLDRDDVDGMSNFLALGGHSLLATRIVARVDEEWGIELELEDFFSLDATLREMAAIVEERRGARNS